jgi:hypothetical protein
MAHIFGTPQDTPSHTKSGSVDTSRSTGGAQKTTNAEQAIANPNKEIRKKFSNEIPITPGPKVASACLPLPKFYPLSG